MLTPVFLRNVL